MDELQRMAGGPNRSDFSIVRPLKGLEARAAALCKAAEKARRLKAGQAEVTLSREDRAVLESLDRDVKRAVARAYRRGWREGGDRLGYPAAVEVLIAHGLALEAARSAAKAIIFEAARTAPGWMWRRE